MDWNWTMITTGFAGICHITAQDVLNTGATLDSVNIRTIQAADAWITLMCRKVVLLHDGLTTGQHESPTHAMGLAVDVAFDDSEGMLDVSHAVMMAVSVGFRGVGVYWNGTAYSMHMDLGMTFRQWAWWKHDAADAWTKDGLIVDPRELECLRTIGG